jgi:hypothetical protein
MSSSRNIAREDNNEACHRRFVSWGELASPFSDCIDAEANLIPWVTIHHVFPMFSAGKPLLYVYRYISIYIYSYVSLQIPNFGACPLVLLPCLVCHSLKKGYIMIAPPRSNMALESICEDSVLA